jgi:hypothetical protein
MIELRDRQAVDSGQRCLTRRGPALVWRPFGAWRCSAKAGNQAKRSGRHDHDKPKSG